MQHKWTSPNKLISVFLASTILLATACGGGAVPAELEVVVSTVKSAHAPDRRLAVFDITLRRAGGRLVVAGEVDHAELKAILLDSLTVATNLEIEDSVTVLPVAELGDRTFGIVDISVANMRGVPSDSAELVNQTRLGTVVRLWKKDDGYYYMQNYDGYLGWLGRSSVTVTDAAGAEEWQSGPRLVCISNYGVILDEPSTAGAAIVDMVPGIVVKNLGRINDWYQVGLPGGEIGFVQADLMRAAAGAPPITVDRVLSTARGFLGINYLWGGNSTKGFDCSGFTQTVFHLNNLPLLRDASQQVRQGEPVDLGDDLAHLLPGDLLFFGRTPERITHVALLLGGKRYINSSGSGSQVHILSLDPEDELFSEYRHSTLQFARRVLPH